MPRNEIAPGDRASRLNSQLAQVQARGLLRAALRGGQKEGQKQGLKEGQFGKVAMVSSFGAEAAVLLHMLSRIAPDTPVLFIDTLMLFPETLDYQARLSADLGLRDVRILRAADRALAGADPQGALHRTDPDACCALRKTAPLNAALAPFDAWISGRKRFQGGARSELPLVEAEVPTGRIKLNPLANWTSADIRAYAAAHDLPPHPLSLRGYGSIGCAPCTVPGEGRAGRWQGSGKSECGIHFENGRAVRAGAEA